MAIETSGSFASATVNGYTVKTTPTTAALSAATNELVSENIAANVDTIENKKIVMGVDIKTAYDNVAASLIVEVSHNGTDWATAVTIDLDVEEDTLGVKTYLVNLTDVFSPYFRLKFNGGKASVGTSGQLEFFFAWK